MIIITYVFYSIKFLIESIFCYAVYNKYQNKDFQSYGNKIKKIVGFSFIHTALLLLYSCSVLGFITYRLVSVFIIFMYFLIQNKKIKDWCFILIYSLFISLIIEFSNFIGYKINYFGIQFLKIPENIIDANLILIMYVSLALHSCILILVYKIDFIKIKTIKKLSSQKLIPILFLCCLSMFIYIKYHIKNLQSYNEFYEILSTILLFFLPIFLCFYTIINKLIRLKNIDQNETEGILTENVISIGIPVINAVINLNLDKYEKDKSIFKKKLERLNINHGYQGYNQMILCLAIIKHFTGDELALEENVFRYVSRITKVHSNVIYNNIKNIIEKTWIQADPEILKEEYDMINIENGCPDVKDFLVYVARKSS